MIPGAGGVQMGYGTILVLSGGTSRQELDSYSYRPDLVVESVADLVREPDLLNDLTLRRNPYEDIPMNLNDWARTHP